MPALIFDCDGVLADTERDGHLRAFNQTFEEFGLPVHWSDDDYAEKLLTAGGKERLRTLLTAEFAAQADLPSGADAQRGVVERWHRRKTEIYAAIVAGGALPERPGVRRLARQAADAGWRLAVASTSTEASVISVLNHVMGERLAARFAVFAGDIVPAKKPAPDIYRLAVDRLQVSTNETVAVEDSHNGLRAALAAGLRCVVTVSTYTVDEDFTGAALVVSHLGEPDGADGAARESEIRADPFGLVAGSYVDLNALEAVLARSPIPAVSTGVS